MQGFAVVGINHKYAPVEVREVLAIGEESLPLALRSLRESFSVEQAMILSTCNRIEIVCHSSCGAIKDRICDFLSNFHRVERSFFEEYIYCHQGLDALRHVFQVASGLDSLVLGETQILSQLKKSYVSASSERATGKHLNEWMHAAFAAAKQVHSDTGVSKGQHSVASVAVTFVKRIFDDLSRKTAMLIGLGDTGKLLLTHLRDAGIGKLIVVNRTLERAQSLAKTFDADAVPLELLDDYLSRADIVISQTAAPTTIISKAQVEEALKRRHGKPMSLIDLAVPRDIQADVDELEGVYRYQIDDLEQVVADATEARTQEYERSKKILDERITEFAQRMSVQPVEPIITNLRTQVDQIVQAEFNRVSSKLSHLSEEELAEILQFSKRVANKIVHTPTRFLTDQARKGEANVLLLEIVSQMLDFSQVLPALPKKKKTTQAKDASSL